MRKAIVLLWGSLAWTADGPLPDGRRDPSGAFTPTGVPHRPPADTSVREMAPGIFRIGGQVTADRAARTIHLPATVNQVEGGVEYLAVTTYGKRHEAVLISTAEPDHLQAAALLLGLPPGAEAAEITLVWQKHGPPMHWDPRALVVLPGPSEPLTGHWRLGRDLNHHAQDAGSLIALIPDPDSCVALVPPEPSRRDLRLAPGRLPPVGTPLGVLLRFPAGD
jgi:hypothetical protein